MDEILKLIKKVNSEDVLPSRWLRRNHIHYKLVCGVDVVICQYLSDNLYLHFILRCDKYIEQVELNSDNIEYINTVKLLLDKLRPLAREL